MKYIEAGLLVRRQFRRFLLSQDIDFMEDRGWIDSVFYLKCTDEKYKWVLQVINKWQKEVKG